MFLLTSAVWHHRLRLLREPDPAKPAGRPEVLADARGGPARGAGAVLHGGQRPLHSRGSGRGAGQRPALPHHLPGHRWAL